MPTKITGHNHADVIGELVLVGMLRPSVARSTVTEWTEDPDTVLESAQNAREALAVKHGRIGHPYASSHAVIRRIAAAANEARVARAAAEAVSS